MKLLCKRHCVVNMIEVAVADENRVYARDLKPGWVLRVAVCPRIDDDCFPAIHYQLKGPVAKPGNLHVWTSYFCEADGTILVMAGSAIPSPYAARFGMVTGSLPWTAISPQRARTAAISEGGTVLYTARYAWTSG
jgi:hypothetical protein